MQMYMSKPKAAVPAVTWANRPSSSLNGALFFATDVGEYGTLLVANGGRWRAVGGAAPLDTLTDAVSGVGAAEQIVMQALIPIGAWQTYDNIRVTIATTKSGGTDVGHLTVRVGTAGTTADTAITGLSAFTHMVAAAQSGGGIYDVKLLSATSAQKVGSATSGTSSYGSGSGSAPSAATAISDVSANAVYVSVGIKSAGATDTVAILSGSIVLVTP